MLAGVFTGLAEYFNVDPVLLRVLWVAFTLGTGIIPGLLFYVIAWLIIPEEPRAKVVDEKEQTKKSAE